jgi:LmbE family N-acetylglucosaminyl deacetylase
MPGILALLAHPDDEFFCSGLLAGAASRGVPVHLAYWTRGEGGGSPLRRLLWECLPRTWHYREREARDAAAILGAASIHFLGAIDPAPKEGLQAPEGKDSDWLEGIERLRDRYNPQLLVTHGSQGDYGHPAHRQLHELARGIAGHSPECTLVTFAATWRGAPAARFANEKDRADYVLDAFPFQEKKREVVQAHRSQKGVLESLVDGSPGSLERLLDASRLEGYRIWSEGPARTQALDLLQRWAGDNVLKKE